MALGDSEDPVHRAHPPVEVHAEDRARSRRKGALERAGIHGVIRTHVDQHRHRPAVDDRRDGRHERVGYRDNLIARAHTGAEQCEMERMVTAVDADRVPHAHEGCEVLLEPPELVSIDQVAVGQALVDRRVDLGLVPAIVSARVHKRDSVRH